MVARKIKKKPRIMKLVRKDVDDINTPAWVVEKILDVIPGNVSTIWECCSGDGHITDVLREHGYEVISTDIKEDAEYDMFKYEPSGGYDMILTNPPFSKKTKVLERLYELDKPFLILCPSFMIETAARFELFQGHGIVLFLMKERIAFEGMPRKCPFFCYWFGHKLGTHYPENSIHYLD